MNKQKWRSARPDDDETDYETEFEPRRRVVANSEDIEEDDEDHDSFAEEDDDPKPLDHLVKLKWRK